MPVIRECRVTLQGNSGSGAEPGELFQQEKGKVDIAQVPLPVPRIPSKQQARTCTPTSSSTSGSSPLARTLVTHGAPLQFKPGTIRRWIKEGDKHMKILGRRWLLKEDRQGKAESSLVIYLKDMIKIEALRMGRRIFHTTCYDWNR